MATSTATFMHITGHEAATHIRHCQLSGCNCSAGELRLRVRACSGASCMGPALMEHAWQGIIAAAQDLDPMA